MKYFVYRNTTVEHLFNSKDFRFSGYGDISYTEIKEDNIVWFYLPPIKANINQLSSEIESYFDKLELVYNSLSKSKTFIILTISKLFNIKPQSSDYSLEIAIDNFNNSIINFAIDRSNIKIINFNEFLAKYSLDKIIDWKYYFLSGIVINPALSSDFKIWFNKKIEEINLIRKKCLVLDLDNTLWGGILGEDGVEGIKIGGEYPGNCFQFFQESILELEKSGIILTICSKNNESDVLEAWEKNPHLILKKEHFAAYKINWNNKADNIKQLAKTLNIGLDSFVFLDDNPSERELIKSFLPSVSVPEFPKQPYYLPLFIKDVCDKYFVSYNVTEEDKKKTEQYIANFKRNEESQKYSTMNEFLKNLQIELIIEEVNEFHISRIAQMTQKTNQFNLTTKRYSESDIVSFIASGSLIYSLCVKDKFGDNGITGCVIINLDNIGEDLVATIDSLLLSCRILGKGIEDAFLIKILYLLFEKNIKKINAQYIPTPRNSQVKDFYEKHSFRLVSEINEIKYYSFDSKEINKIKLNDDIYKITIR